MEGTEQIQKKLVKSTAVKKPDLQTSEIICHNVQSLRDKIDQIRLIIAERETAIFVAVETWLDGSHRNSEVCVNGYNMIRRDRAKDPNRGGIVVYTKKGIDVTGIDIENHSDDCNCENIWLKLSFGTCKTIILGAVYRSHLNKNFTSHIKTDLQRVSSMKHPIILVGDFNYDLLKDSGETIEYYRTFTAHLMEQLIRAPTRITETTATIIDHIWTTNEEIIECSDTLNGISDHQMCRAVLRFAVKKVAQKPFVTRSFKNFSREAYQEDIDGTNWDFIEEGIAIDDIWRNWHGKFMDILDMHAPTITVKNKKDDAPWMTHDIKQQIRLKMAAKLEREDLTSATTIRKFRDTNNQTKKIIAIAKQAYFRNKVIINKTNPRKLWDIMKEAAPSSFKERVASDNIENEANILQ